MSGVFDYQQVIFRLGDHPRREDRNLGGLRLDRALRALETHPGAQTGDILEAGCGVGRFTIPLGTYLPGARLTAFDLSHAAITEAARRGRSAEYIVADTLALPFADGEFDAVVFFDLLEHLENPAAALAEFARVTVPHGLLHGYVPCEGQPPTLHWLLGGRAHSLTRRHAGHVRHFRHADVCALIRQSGFTVLDLSYSCHLLGQALDIATFMAREAIYRRRGGGSESPGAFYDRSALGSGRLPRIYGVARRAIEATVYAESRLCGRFPWASGVHVTARRLSDG